MTNGNTMTNGNITENTVPSVPAVVLRFVGLTS